MPEAISLPPEVASEIASYLRSQLFAPLSSNITRLSEECEGSIEAQKDLVQDAQVTISQLVEPAANALVPIAEELEDVYAQIDLLEELLARSGESIRVMAQKVGKTEAAVRREGRAVEEGRGVPLWEGVGKEGEGVKFRAGEWVEAGRLKRPDERTAEAPDG